MSGVVWDHQARSCIVRRGDSVMGGLSMFVQVLTICAALEFGMVAPSPPLSAGYSSPTPLRDPTAAISAEKQATAHI